MAPTQGPRWVGDSRPLVAAHILLLNITREVLRLVPGDLSKVPGFPREALAGWLTGWGNTDERL